MPDKVDARIARVAGEQWGVVSLAELTGCGLSRDAVMLRVRAGPLHPLHWRVHGVGHANPPLRAASSPPSRPVRPTPC